MTMPIIIVIGIVFFLLIALIACCIYYEVPDGGAGRSPYRNRKLFGK